MWRKSPEYSVLRVFNRDTYKLSCRSSVCTTAFRAHDRMVADRIPSYFRSTDQYALSRNVFQLAYFGLPSLIVKSGLCFGRTGLRISFRPASCGVRPPLRTLHRTHAQTRFSQLVSPPRHVGTIWSRLSSLVANRLPQYWQWLLSRAKMLRRFSRTRCFGTRS